MGGREMRAHTGHSKFCLRSSGNTRHAAEPADLSLTMVTGSCSVLGPGVSLLAVNITRSAAPVWTISCCTSVSPLSWPSVSLLPVSCNYYHHTTISFIVSIHYLYIVMINIMIIVVEAVARCEMLLQLLRNVFSCS